MRCYCRAGLSTLINDPDHYGFSLALGSADVTLLDLTNALSCHCGMAGSGPALSLLCRSGATATSVCPNESVAAKPLQRSRALSENTARLAADMPLIAVRAMSLSVR